MTPTSLWLLRHPEPVASARDRCYGSLDVALSEEGVRQAHRMAAALPRHELARIYSSPRRRCLRAAEIVAAEHGCRVEKVDALAELNFGEFEGRSYDEISARYPDLYRQWMEHPTEVRFPGGESFAAMRQRVAAAAREILTRHTGESIAAITHGGVIRILLADVLAIPPENIFRVGQPYGAINLIRYYGTEPVVEMLNA